MKLPSKAGPGINGTIPVLEELLGYGLIPGTPNLHVQTVGPRVVGGIADNRVRADSASGVHSAIAAGPRSPHRRAIPPLGGRWWPTDPSPHDRLNQGAERLHSEHRGKPFLGYRHDNKRSSAI